MSMGIGGSCRKISESDTEVIYEYSSYNLNEPEHRNENGISDGFITIKKPALPVPEIHKSIKRTKNGKKKVFVRKILGEFSVRDLIVSGQLHIDNCGNMWESDGGYDIMAPRLCRKLICEYQLNSRFPEKECYNI